MSKDLDKPIGYWIIDEYSKLNVYVITSKICIAGMNDDSIVVLSSDEEGNSFSPFDS